MKTIRLPTPRLASAILMEPRMRSLCCAPSDDEPSRSSSATPTICERRPRRRRGDSSHHRRGSRVRAVFSPDGSQIAFHRPVRRKRRCVRHSRDRGTPKRLTYHDADHVSVGHPMQQVLSRPAASSYSNFSVVHGSSRRGFETQLPLTVR